MLIEDSPFTLTVPEMLKVREIPPIEMSVKMTFPVDGTISVAPSIVPELTEDEPSIVSVPIEFMVMGVYEIVVPTTSNDAVADPVPTFRDPGPIIEPPFIMEEPETVMILPCSFNIANEGEFMLSPSNVSVEEGSTTKFPEPVIEVTPFPLIVVPSPPAVT